MRMPDFIIEIMEACEDLKKEQEEQNRQMRRAEAKAKSKAGRKR